MKTHTFNTKVTVHYNETGREEYNFFKLLFKVTT